MTKNSTERQWVRNTLLKNGYVPLPLADKGVYIKGWSRAEITPDWLAAYARNGRYGNTGIRCDNVVAFDIDVLDEDLADECEDYIIEQCGDTPLCRVGRWPKRLLVYRLEHLDRKMARSARTGKYGPHMCELLATHGRQFAAFGTHPSGSEYYWMADDDDNEPSPLNTPVAELPGIDAEMAQDVLEGLDALLAATGLERERRPHMRGLRGQDEYDLTDDTEVMVNGEITTWGELVPQLDKDGVFGNLWRDEYDDWGDSSAVHFYLAHNSGEACAHDFVNDCTHWTSLWRPEFGELLPPPPKADDSVFIPEDMANMIQDAVLMSDATVRRLSEPHRAYPLGGWRAAHQHLQVPDPNPPKSNPNKMIPFTQLWERDPNTLRADYAVLRPDHPDDVIVRLGRTRVLNTYRRPNHDPAGAGEIDTFMEFMAHLVPRQREREIFLDWLANKTARPGDRMHGMVMVTPAYGTGRGTLVQIMQRLFGEDYLNEVELSDLIGINGQAQFNSFLADSLIVTVGEALEEREDISKWQARHVAYERLKVVCDPISNRMHVRRKYGQNSTETIFASIFISSNHLDALAIQPGDRRLVVLDNGETPLVNAERNLYNRIHAWKENRANVATLYYWLAERGKHIRYDPYGEPPATPAKDRMIEAGQSDVDRLFEIFVEQCPGDIVTPAQWRSFAHKGRMKYDLDLPADPQRRENALNVVIQQKARRIETLPKSGIKVFGQPVRPWIIRNFTRWRSVENNDDIRLEIEKNGNPGSNVVELPTRRD